MCNVQLMFINTELIKSLVAVFAVVQIETVEKSFVRLCD